MTIPLHRKVKKIYRKIMESFQIVFQINDIMIIKEVCKIAGIDEKIKGKKQKNISKEKNIPKIEE